MNKAKIEACEKLCREFLKRAKAVEAKAAKNQMEYHTPHDFDFLTSGTRESGALRRISLDLTMALADLRRPG